MNGEMTYKDFLGGADASPEMIHALLLACRLRDFCDAAYPEGRLDGVTADQAYEEIMTVISMVRRYSIDFPEEEEEITVGRALTIARAAKEKSRQESGNGSVSPLLVAHNVIVYLLLIKPYADRVLQGREKPRDGKVYTAEELSYVDKYSDLDLADPDDIPF